ncbi:hypothetical protein EVAR_98842_1 [Eumeta japonica]|uniref:Uncharacterized protein n=1 Tax=Eumeta variegata TaxID=151549 RepID=A0A4C1YMU0_EUMVA|nr:hypothetical protein EVAR_98842_1 [Eumeta japonica]
MDHGVMGGFHPFAWKASVQPVRASFNACPRLPAARLNVTLTKKKSFIALTKIARSGRGLLRILCYVPEGFATSQPSLKPVDGRRRNCGHEVRDRRLKSIKNSSVDSPSSGHQRLSFQSDTPTEGILPNFQ